MKLDEARALNAHRFPQAATVKAPADGGGVVPIQLLIGLPSGACRMPPGAVVSPAWAQFVASVLRQQPDPEGWRELFVQDVVLYPSPREVADLLERWPAISAPICQAALGKLARDAVVAPLPTEKPPKPIASALSAHPRATWRHVRPAKGQAFVLAVEPPSTASWQVFFDGVRRADSDAWALALDMAHGCTVAACKADGGHATIEEVTARWPGVALSLVGTIGTLAGAAAEVELGE